MRFGAPRLPIARSWDLPDGGFAAAGSPGGEGPSVPVPAGWVAEPADETAWRACLGGAPAGPGLAARHPSDYAIVLRAWRLPLPDADAERLVAGCPAAEHRFERLGAVYEVAATVVSRGGDTLLLELEAPATAWPLLKGALARWAAEVAPANR
jgi:hypothetical protein